MTRGEALRYMTSRLEPLLGPFARPESETVLQTLLSVSRTELLLHSATILEDSTLKSIETILERRFNHEPLQYILERAYFYDREFFVNRHVLIPRPDTETLVELVLSAEENSPIRFVDIGTGSGIIATVLSSHRPAWKPMALDISVEALHIARVNSNGSIPLLCSNMLSALKEDREFDFLVSNPPYISEEEMATLDRSVIDFEPHGALAGGADGLQFYEYLAETGPRYLKKGGRIYVEIGYNQGESVKSLFERQNWSGVKLTRDLEGRPRVISAQWDK